MRRIEVRKTDVLVIDGLEITGEVLGTVLSVDARVLWAFVRSGADLQPVPYSEDKVIWLEDTDLVRE